LLRIIAIPSLPIYIENFSEDIIDGIFISHPHTDHFSYVSTLNRAIPVYLGEASSIIVNSFAQMKSSRFEDDFGGIDFRIFKNSQKIKINGLEIGILT
jgi:mRNA degradation ribonuclease J1/J2